MRPNVLTSTDSSRFQSQNHVVDLRTHPSVQSVCSALPTVCSLLSLFFPLTLSGECLQAAPLHRTHPRERSVLCEIWRKGPPTTTDSSVNARTQCFGPVQYESDGPRRCQHPLPVVSSCRRVFRSLRKTKKKEKCGKEAFHREDY